KPRTEKSVTPSTTTGAVTSSSSASATAATISQSANAARIPPANLPAAGGHFPLVLGRTPGRRALLCQQCGGVDRDAEPFGHPDQVRQRTRRHLLHHPGAMDLDRLLADAQLPGDLLVDQAGGDQREHLALAGGELLVLHLQPLEHLDVLDPVAAGSGRAP